MSAIGSILLLLDGSSAAAQGVDCAIWLAERLQARLHILYATARPLPRERALEELRVPRAHWSRMSLHQTSTPPERAVLDAIQVHAVDLVVMAARGESSQGGIDLTKPVGHVARAVIEGSPVPVLLLPPLYREALPWESALVPTDGEAAADDALVSAVRLGRALGLKVRVVHCVRPGGAEPGEGSLSCYADAPHHEYPPRLREMVDRAVACCTREECSCIEEVLLCHGDIAREISDLIEHKHVSLLVVGWQGSFAMGHADVVKQLLGTIACPVLLVKPVPRAPFVLRVGETLDKGEATNG